MPRLRLLARRLTGTHPLLVDLALALFITGVTLKLGYGSYPAAGPRPFDGVGVALTALASMPLVLRRRAPMVTLVACELALVAYEARGYWLGLGQLGPQIALMSLASRRGRGWIAAGAVLVAPGMMYSNVHTWNGSPVDTLVLSTGWLVTICVVGDGLRRLRMYGEIVAGNAERLRAEQHEREQRAVFDERVRIARELHDVVAHHMSVVSVQAGLARYVLASDPATAQTALDAIADMSSEALDEVRRLVTVLRPDLAADPAGSDRTGPDTHRVDDLAVMIERVGLTGAAVEFDVCGEAQPLPAGVGLCLYRVVQESLTNAVRHAPGARISVSLRYGPNQITARIRNDGRGTGPGVPTRNLAAGGKGLVGMHERATLYGGTLSAGALPGGGFEVVLTLPIRSTPVEITPTGQPPLQDPLSSGLGAAR